MSMNALLRSSQHSGSSAIVHTQSTLPPSSTNLASTTAIVGCLVVHFVAVVAAVALGCDAKQ
jgi:hypothetical protein